jgi:hypothetical protein
MRAAMRWTSLVLYSLVGLFLIWFGYTYASVRGMLWFHAAAVPETARGEVLSLYIALMTLIGAASAALGLLALFVIWGPVRRGMAGASIALSAAFALVFAGAAFTAERLAAETGAPVSWHIMGVLLGVTLAALLAHSIGAPHRSRTG